MASQQSANIKETVLSYPIAPQSTAAEPDTPRSTISAVFDTHEALQQEAESRAATEEIRQQRIEASALSRSRKKAQKPTFPRLKPQWATGDASNQHRAHLAAISPRHTGYLYQNDRPLTPAFPAHFTSGPFTFQSGSFMPPQLSPVPPFIPGNNLEVQQAMYRSSQHNIPISSPRSFERPPSHLTHKQMTEAALEDEYEKSRGAYFRHLAPAADANMSMRLGQPRLGVPEIARSDVTSLAGEVVDVEDEVEALEEGPEDKRGNGMEEVVERLTRVEEKLDRVLRLLEGGISCSQSCRK